jgi:hypothetical protein
LVLLKTRTKKQLPITPLFLIRMLFLFPDPGPTLVLQRFSTGHALSIVTDYRISRSRV